MALLLFFIVFLSCLGGSARMGYVGELVFKFLSCLGGSAR
ncbi:hypothetical protein KUC_0973 [Vreelandella boliviensis LC1]|uniref:Uncharacterized protein n=1 Tax=Vreelandella boliviensis LC1 TaxID=1072583 RepID=A0A7U9GH40_9GAMM|nr:hypothetical protein KUC_0973 [Halomonas boliviensis LC1]